MAKSKCTDYNWTQRNAPVLSDPQLWHISAIWDRFSSVAPPVLSLALSQESTWEELLAQFIAWKDWNHSALCTQSYSVLDLRGSLAQTDEKEEEKEEEGEDVYQKINKIFKCVPQQLGQCSGNQGKTNSGKYMPCLACVRGNREKLWSWGAGGWGGGVGGGGGGGLTALLPPVGKNLLGLRLSWWT